MASDAEWHEFMTLAEQMFAEVGNDFSRVRSLAISDGGGPTARQRQALVTRFPVHQFPGAVVTSSRLARGIANALGWFYPSIKTFAPGDFGRALAHIGINDAEAADLVRTIAVANEAIGVETVGAIRPPARLRASTSP
jgi:hypothetical protein